MYEAHYRHCTIYIPDPVSDFLKRHKDYITCDVQGLTDHIAQWTPVTGWKDKHTLQPKSPVRGIIECFGIHSHDVARIDDYVQCEIPESFCPLGLDFTDYLDIDPSQHLWKSSGNIRVSYDAICPRWHATPMGVHEVKCILDNPGTQPQAKRFLQKAYGSLLTSQQQA